MNRNDTSNTLSLADVALRFPHALKVLHRYDLDYSCRGSRDFVSECIRTGLEPQKVWKEIEQEIPPPGNSSSAYFNRWDPVQLIDFISDNHHVFARLMSRKIITLMDFAFLPQNRDEMLLKEAFTELNEGLTRCMAEEDEVVFPALKRMFKNGPSAQIIAPHIFSWKSAARSNYQTWSVQFREIRRITEGYTQEQQDHGIKAVLYKLLEEFDHDLTHHIHLENNILFYKIEDQAENLANTGQ